MGGSAVCDFLGCGEEGTIVSRLSPEGFLVATGKKAYSFREAYRRFHYCGNHHDELMGGVWSRVRKPEDKKEGHVAPTAIKCGIESVLNYDSIPCLCPLP